jgi:hypothetical protein
MPNTPIRNAKPAQNNGKFVKLAVSGDFVENVLITPVEVRMAQNQMVGLGITLQITNGCRYRFATHFHHLKLGFVLCTLLHTNSRRVASLANLERRRYDFYGINFLSSLEQLV